MVELALLLSIMALLFILIGLLVIRNVIRNSYKDFEEQIKQISEQPKAYCAIKVIEVITRAGETFRIEGVNSFEYPNNGRSGTFELKDKFGKVIAVFYAEDVKGVLIIRENEVSYGK